MKEGETLDVPDFDDIYADSEVTFYLSHLKTHSINDITNIYFKHSAGHCL